MGTNSYRGPIWIITGLTMMLCGVDIFMMLHPSSVSMLKEIGNTFTKEHMSSDVPDISGWITELG